MSEDRIKELVQTMEGETSRAVRLLGTSGAPWRDFQKHFEKLEEIQARYCREFPVIDEEVRFWETLWRRTDRVRDQWLRPERPQTRALAARDLSAALSARRLTFSGRASPSTSSGAP